MSRRWARRIERSCCLCATYFPLAFVYGITTWALWVQTNIGAASSRSKWIGPWSSAVAVALYLMLNWSYTTAVFTPPGSTTNDAGYSSLPTQAPPRATSFTVKANGEIRFCKKCQARKPDRAHHCSTCRRCVLKMDHHCPWLATCIGLRNHKAFLLFLIYTTFFSLFGFGVAGSWVWTEIVDNDTTYVDNFMPVQYIMLCVVGGIIALVVGAFTIWHILLASRGQTTIECLEKTRYLSPLRKTLHQAYNAQHSGHGVPLPQYGQQLLDIHQNVLPGITRPEEGEETRSATPLQPIINPQGSTHPNLGPEAQMGRRITYDDLERYRARKRYEEYLDDQDSQKLPNAFDLGVRRNLRHLFGPSPWLWFIPICNTTGDGWSWEASPKWLAVRNTVRSDRDEQRDRERAAGWGGTPLASPAPWTTAAASAPANRQNLQPLPSPGPSSGRLTPSKADRVLGRDPGLYADDIPSPVSMRRLSPAGRELEDDDFDLSSDEEAGAAAERRALNLTNGGGWVGRGAGASGLLRKSSKPTLANHEATRHAREDEGVD